MEKQSFNSKEKKIELRTVKYISLNFKTLDFLSVDKKECQLSVEAEFL